MKEFPLLRALAILILAFVLSVSMVHAQESSSQVVSIDGDIFVTGRSGQRVQLTALGLDAAPCLSSDARWVAFVRRTPDYVIETGHPGFPDSNEIWIARADRSSRPRLLLRGKPGSFDTGRPDGLVLANFFEPQFSPDGKRLYFGASTWATSAAFWVIDIETGRPRFLLSAVTLEVIRHGPFTGNLLVMKRLLDRQSPRYPYYLLDSQGKDLKEIGETEAELRAFKIKNGISKN